MSPVRHPSSESFDADPYPGRPRVLFVGLSESTHTHSWIDLLASAPLNCRLFALPTGLPPSDWPVKTYVSGGIALASTAHRRYLGFPHPTLRDLARAMRDRLRGRPEVWLGPPRSQLAEGWLAEIIQEWRPHIVHTLGIDEASYFYHRVRRRIGCMGVAAWVVQDRGPDLWMHRHLPEHATAIREVLASCDRFVSDNALNYELAPGLGLPSGRTTSLGIVPCTGGVDIDELAASRSRRPPSRRRLIFWPKAYECPQSKALPVFDAIRLAWDRLQPCEIRMSAAIPETRMWFETLPAEIRKGCSLHDRMPRAESLAWMAEARVMLAPSLSDGIPNTLWEAMATGALPIISPIEPIRPVVEHGRHVLFARNLYPEELAAALVRAMEDDTLVERAAAENLPLVRSWADRKVIGPKVIAVYEELAARSRT